MKLQALLYFSILIFLSGLSFGQVGKELKSGKIIYEISYQDENLNSQNSAMMPKESIMYFKGTKTRVEIIMAMGETAIITDNSSKKSIVLMNFMGNKMAMEMDLTESKKEIDKNGSIKVELQSGVKEILGYKCKKAKIIQTNKSEESSFDIWYTNEISANNATANGIEGVDGCMLEFEISQNGIEMKLTTKSISEQNIEDEKFIIPEGYTLTSADLLKSMMGGGGK